jgi:hypothetical protein
MPNKTLGSITASGTPSWISDMLGMPQTRQVAPDGQIIADVTDTAPNMINVAMPDRYTPLVAAHEATHVFQNSRNPAFTTQMVKTLPPTIAPSNYDYGGTAGLRATPFKSIGNYNPEQQAKMVEDLTAAQDNLKPGMSRAALQQWDDTKNTLERPIQQLQRVPPPDNSRAERGDSWLHQHGINGDILERLKGVFQTPQMPTGPQPPPQAPSVALGYANRSKLVR